MHKSRSLLLFAGMAFVLCAFPARANAPRTRFLSAASSRTSLTIVAPPMARATYTVEHVDPWTGARVEVSSTIATSREIDAVDPWTGAHYLPFRNAPPSVDIDSADPWVARATRGAVLPSYAAELEAPLLLRPLALTATKRAAFDTVDPWDGSNVVAVAARTTRAARSVDHEDPWTN